MENATKALLIAAAVLIAIILISLGLAVVRQGQEAVQDADLSEAEATQFNSKFTMYEGKKVSTSRVNTMLNAVFAHNSQEQASGTKNYVKVWDLSYGTRRIILESDATTVEKKSGNSYYSVVCEYTRSLVTSIIITRLP